MGVISEFAITCHSSQVKNTDVCFIITVNAEVSPLKPAMSPYLFSNKRVNQQYSLYSFP